MLSRTVILEHEQVSSTIKRMAFEVLERNLKEKEIVLVGIRGNGYILAERLYDELSTKKDIKITLCKILMNKKDLLADINTSIDIGQALDKSVVLVDDVLHSGATLMYAVRHLLSVRVKQLKTVVLIDRNHKRFPIKADIKGLSLSTSLQENVVVVLRENSYRAYLE